MSDQRGERRGLAATVAARPPRLHYWGQLSEITGKHHHFAAERGIFVAHKVPQQAIYCLHVELVHSRQFIPHDQRRIAQ